MSREPTRGNTIKTLSKAEFNDLLDELPSLSHHEREGVEFVHFDAEVAAVYSGSSYVIPFVSDIECIVTCRSNGRWVLPGGTLDSGEDWLQAAHRELMEETGSIVRNITPIGMYRCISQDESPRLPHIPHPMHVRIVSVADADQVARPSDPDDNSKITEVRTVSYNDAFDLFSIDDQDFAALYHMAYRVRKQFGSTQRT